MPLDVNCNDFDKLYAHLKLSEEMLDDALYGLNDNRLRLFQSRSYYSCVHSVNALFYLYGILNEKNGILNHRGLKTAFNTIFIYKECIFDSSLFAILRDSSDRRDKADYKVDVFFSKEASLKNYDKVKFFVDTLKNKIETELEKINKHIQQ